MKVKEVLNSAAFGERVDSRPIEQVIGEKESKHLRNRRLLGMKFRRQYPVGKYILDFACVEKKVGIELDGGQHAIMQEKDRERDLFLKDKGYLIIRVWNNEALKNTEAIMGYIEYVLNRTRPHPGPLPQAGEGDNEYADDILKRGRSS